MSKLEFEGTSQEDFVRFEKLLVDFYQRPWEESYARLTKEIGDRLLHKDSRPRVKLHVSNNLDDLVSRVVSRFIKINSTLQEAGKEIESFYGMLESRIGYVYREELRIIAREPVPIDPELPTGQDSAHEIIENEEQWAIEIDCYRKSFARLPAHIKTIFLEYYDPAHVSPRARTEARQDLALRVAKVNLDEVTPTELKALKRNLYSNICKWRKNRLNPWKNECLKQSLKKPPIG